MSSMSEKRYDVVVVGCGPGGAMAGKFASLNGAETLIIEQKRQIGFPVFDPHGLIYSKTEMEETTGEPVEPQAIHARAEGLRYISPSGKECKPLLLPDGIFVNKQLFEKSLAIGAVRAGAETMLHTRVVDLVKERGSIKGVIVKTGSGVMTIPCSIVVAADGGCQHIAHLAGIKPSSRRVNVGIGCEFVGVRSLHGPSRIDEIYMGPADAMHRYTSPYGEDRFTAGCAVPRHLLKGKRGLKLRLEELIRHVETIGRYDFSRASPVSVISGSLATMKLSATPRRAADGIILVGDAAGAALFSSRYGIAGMLKAAKTGRVAGEIAAAAVRQGDVSESFLGGAYQDALGGSLKEEERQSILEADSVRSRILDLSPEKQERAVDEIGWEISALHFYSKGGMASPLPSCLESAQRWLRENL